MKLSIRQALYQAPAVIAFVVFSNCLAGPETAPDSRPATVAATQSSSAPATLPASEPSVVPAADAATQPSTIDDRAASTRPLARRVVTADLDLTRQQIAPSPGAASYTIGRNQIENVPGGPNASFQQVLLRAPGVVQDSFGQEHVRGEHANLTYRVNGVLLPQPVNVFGQELDTRLIDSVTLIDGSLTAQFGFHTAGIVDVTTKSGATLNHNEISFYGGMYDTVQPSIELGGTAGNLDYFITASSNHNDLGIENTTSGHHALHDYTDQERLFTYLSWHIDDTSRLSLFINGYDGDFEIPASPDLPAAFSLAGHPAALSRNTNENQNEQEYYTVVAYQKTVDKLSYQLSGFVRYGQITFKPDYVNDVIFQGVAGAIYNSYATYGTQLDGDYVLNARHTIRAGLIADYTLERLGTTTAIFPVDASGAQTSNNPTYLSDHSGNEASEYGIYIQDEFKLTDQVTFNFGARYDRFDANFDHEGQLSPRANLVWKLDEATTVHGGHSRYFTPPPVQNLGQASINKFANTTNAPANFADNPPRAERANYYDIGLSRQFTKALTVTVDGFYKQARQLVDLGQFGPAIIESPFNYRSGTVYGAELGATYKEHGFSAFGNFAWVKTMAHDIDTQQFNIDPDELAYIKTHNIYLDHDSTYTISAGASYSWPKDRVYIDMLYGSGLRSGFANTSQEPQHYPVNAGFEHIFRGGFWGSNNVRCRVDVVNIFDQSYQLRQGGGLGINADQFGQRRSVYAGVTYEF